MGLHRCGWLIFLWVLVFSGAQSFGAKKKCADELGAVRTAEAILVDAEMGEETKKTLKAFLAIPEEGVLRQWLDEAEVLRVVGNPTFPVYGGVLGKILKALGRSKSTKSEAVVEKAIQKALQGEVSEGSIGQRLADLSKKKKGAVVRALGDNELDEVNDLLYGTELGSPSSESLIGQYVAATGATFRLRSYPTTEGGKHAAVKRLEVALSEKTLPTFKKIFSGPEFTTFVGHALLIHETKVVGIRYDEMRLPHEGLALPLVVMKTTEGQRMKQFFRLFQKLGQGWHHVAALPWMLEGYCATGGYQCCTHWIGNMPVGDEVVEAYSFPANFEAGEKKPKTQKLKAYEHADPLVKRVWGVPGQMQFADMLGLRAANLASDFATTTSIVNTLLGKAKIDRVPVVFRVVADHKAEIPDDYIVAH